MDNEVVLILNAGSSSVKFSAMVSSESASPIFRGQIDGLATKPRFSVRRTAGERAVEQVWQQPMAHADAIEHLIRWISSDGLAGHRIRGIGHRVVHGGAGFTRPVLIDDDVLRKIESLIPLAPLHQPHNSAAILACAAMSPGLPQVACFDTAFHHTQSPLATTFAIPRDLTSSGIRRYGFHGLSFEYIASVLPSIDPGAAEGRTIVAHLGNGVSLCALQSGRSIATTMGLTPLDGLVMGTRCGAIDPGVLLYLLQANGMNVDEVQRLLYEQSGLLGVSGLSADMRELLHSTDPRAREAIDLFVYRVVREFGSLAAALGGIDAIVFTGGIGEHAAVLRQEACRQLRWLGIELDEQANERHGPRISQSQSPVSVWVVPTNEELMIAKHTMQVLSQVRMDVDPGKEQTRSSMDGDRHDRA